MSYAAALQLVPKAVFDQWGDLDIGEPEQAWACAIDRFKEEARHNRQCAEQCQRTAEDARKQGAMHAARAADFENLALAIERASVTFAAQGTPTQRAETTGSVGEADGGPVPNGDAPNV